MTGTRGHVHGTAHAAARTGKERVDRPLARLLRRNRDAIGFVLHAYRSAVRKALPDVPHLLPRRVDVPAAGVVNVTAGDGGVDDLTVGGSGRYLRVGLGFGFEGREQVHVPLVVDHPLRHRERDRWATGDRLGHLAAAARRADPVPGRQAHILEGVHR